MRFGRIWRSQRQANMVNRLLQGCQSGQMDLTVNQAGYALRRFESYPLHTLVTSLTAPAYRCGGDLSEDRISGAWRGYFYERGNRPLFNGWVRDRGCVRATRCECAQSITVPAHFYSSAIPGSGASTPRAVASAIR